MLTGYELGICTELERINALMVRATPFIVTIGTKEIWGEVCCKLDDTEVFIPSLSMLPLAKSENSGLDKNVSLRVRLIGQLCRTIPRHGLKVLLWKSVDVP